MYVWGSNNVVCVLVIVLLWGFMDIVFFNVCDGMLWGVEVYG